MRDLTFNFLKVQPEQNSGLPENVKEYLSLHPEEREEITKKMEVLSNRRMELLKTFTETSTGLFIIQSTFGIGTNYHLKKIYTNKENAFVVPIFNPSFDDYFDYLEKLPERDFVCIDTMVSSSQDQAILIKTLTVLSNLDFKKIIIITRADESTVKEILSSLHKRE